MSTLGSSEQPLRVAIVGSGPSGFYAADALLRADVHVVIDIFDRLATPYGLVRHGVAPDHQKIKNVIKVYEGIASQSNVSFYGNITIGRDVTIDELREYYDAVILAVGAETDRRLGIPGEDLPGSHTATEFVAWYNGHPDYFDREFDLSAESAVVIGQGNVAVDVCRILSKTVEELKETDIAQHALDALSKSNIKNVYMVGRRGPVQAKFTLLEIKEMGRLEDCDPIVVAEDLEYDDASRAELEDPGNKSQQKVVSVLEEFGKRAPEGKTRKLHILFRRSPKEIRGTERVESIVLERNTLQGEPFKIRAVGTGETEEIPCGLVFRSVGYRGIAVPGVPFDENAGVIPNADGRVKDGDAPVPGLYVVGWIKRGPSGVIGTNKPDSQATVASLLEDARTLQPCPNRKTETLLNTLHERGVRVITFGDWKRVDAHEIERGQAVGKPREKLTSVQSILDLLGGR